jgi:hypothetical protein
MVVPPWCVEEDLESGRLVALGSDPYITIRYGIARLKSHSLTAASARFREFVLEAEWGYTQREGQLFERWRPQPASKAAARSPAPAGTPVRRAPQTRARQSPAPER